jgi:lipoprotein NlpD
MHLQAFITVKMNSADKVRLFLGFVTKCILLIILLSACTSKNIYNNKAFNPPVYFGTHVVEKDETLFSIAWRYGRGFKELASANNIPAPYLIKPGQIIKLEVSEQVYRKRDHSVGKTASVAPNVTERKQKSNSGYKKTTSKKPNNLKNIKWQWPHVGPILAKYKTQGSGHSINKGIDIGGRVGDSIFAAASGEVVYAGDGLLGYGNLIIINHNQRYLSAYGHNRAIFVKEGEKLNAGQKIAEMGKKTQRAIVHFEIRRDGQPVDPMRYLPNK